MANFTVFEGGVTSTKEGLPNIDFRYGPYQSKSAACLALEEDELICNGLTIGIEEDNEVVEYWFQGGTDSDHLVPKQTSSKMVWE